MDGHVSGGCRNRRLATESVKQVHTLPVANSAVLRAVGKFTDNIAPAVINVKGSHATCILRLRGLVVIHARSSSRCWMALAFLTPFLSLTPPNVSRNRYRRCKQLPHYEAINETMKRCGPQRCMKTFYLCLGINVLGEFNTMWYWLPNAREADGANSVSKTSSQP